MARGQQCSVTPGRPFSSRQFTLDIGHEHRSLEAGESLGRGSPGTGGTDDWSVRVVGLVRPQEALGRVMLRNQDRIRHEAPKKYNRASGVTNFRRIFRGRTQQMGQYSAP